MSKGISINLDFSNNDLLEEMFDVEVGKPVDKEAEADMNKAWDDIETFMKKNLNPQCEYVISDLITTYASEAEEKGFRAGFKMATKLMVAALGN